MAGFRKSFARDISIVVLSVVIPLSATPARAVGTEALDEKSALAYSQAAIGRTVGDYTLTDMERRRIRLADFRGKPLVINMVYTGCTQACPLVIQTLFRSIETAQASVGRDSFNVVTIGFDVPHDTPERMRAYRKSQGAELPHWLFAAGDADTVEHLSADLGFVFFPSSKGFDHLAQTTVLDASGTVYSQIYGADFEPPTFVEPLKDLLYGRRSRLGTVEGIVNRVRLLCTLYDPVTGRYRFNYSMFFGMGFGALSLLAFGGLVARLWLRDYKRRRNA